LTAILFLICSPILTSAQNKVVILDSIQANKIIKQLIQGDVAKAKLIVCEQMDSLSQERIKGLKTANSSLLSAYNEKQLETNNYKEVVNVQEKIIKKEKRKKNFFKISTFISIGASFYLLLLN
jgi:hypothetical protein